MQKIMRVFVGIFALCNAAFSLADSSTACKGVENDTSARRCIVDWMKTHEKGENSESSDENGWNLSSSQQSRKNLREVIAFIRAFNRSTGLSYNRVLMTDKKIEQFDAYMVVALANDETQLEYYGLSYDPQGEMVPQLIAEMTVADIDWDSDSTNTLISRFTLGMVLWSEESDQRMLMLN